MIQTGPGFIPQRHKQEYEQHSGIVGCSPLGGLGGLLLRRERLSCCLGVLVVGLLTSPIDGAEVEMYLAAVFMQ